jgi:Protein of unknown function (DUF2490)
MKLNVIGLFFLWALSTSVQAQQQSAGWFANQTTISLNKHWGIITGVNIRTNDKWLHLQVIGVRAAISYNIRKNFSLAAGIEHNHSRKLVSNVSGYFDDEAIWQHILVSQPVKAFNIIHRLRLEERFLSNLSLQNNKIKEDGSNFAERIRYLFRVSYPFSGKKGFKKGGYIAVQDEIMFNVGNKSAVNGRFFDQNRIYGGVGYRFFSKFDAEIGYLRQYVVTAGGNSFNNNVIQLGTFLRL